MGGCLNYQNSKHKSFKVVHRNAQTVSKNKVDEVSLLCDKLKYDIFIVR